METRDLQKHKREELGNLETVRVSLGLPDEEVNSNLKECLRSQNIVFPSTKHLGKPSARYMQMSMSLLEKQDSYQAWLQSSHGCLLVLGGTTKPEGQMQQSGYSWLSPAATDTAATFQKSAERIVAFFSCHPKSWLSVGEESSSRALVAGLIFQVLSSEPAVLKDDFQRQLASLDVETWSGKREKDILNVIMRSVVGLFRKVSKRRWIYLIVDRAERCRSGLRLLLNWFRELAMDPECRVKVLIVFDTIKSDMAEQDWEDLLEDSQGYVYTRTGWNQDKLGFEKSPLREPVSL